MRIREMSAVNGDIKKQDIIALTLLRNVMVASKSFAEAQRLNLHLAILCILICFLVNNKYALIGLIPVVVLYLASYFNHIHLRMKNSYSRAKFEDNAGYNFLSKTTRYVGYSNGLLNIELDANLNAMVIGGKYAFDMFFDLFVIEDYIYFVFYGSERAYVLYAKAGMYMKIVIDDNGEVKVNNNFECVTNGSGFEGVKLFLI